MTRLFVRGLFDPTTAGFVPASGGGTATFLRADGTWAGTSGGGATLADGDYGDVTVSGTGTVITVDALPESRITNLVTDLAAKVPTGRTITCTTPLKINGTTVADLSANDTLSIIAFTTALAGAVNASSAAGNVLRGDNTWSTITQLTAALNLFTTSLQGLVPASGGGTVNFLRADGTWAPPTTPPQPYYDTVIDMTGTPISFGAAYDAWNVGALGQNTLIQYITDGAPSGTSSRAVRGLAGGADKMIATFMNMSPNLAGTAQFQHQTGTAGSAFTNASQGAVTGNTSGCVTYYYDGPNAIWHQISTT